jgi:hypothetical protein
MIAYTLCHECGTFEPIEVRAEAVPLVGDEVRVQEVPYEVTSVHHEVDGTLADITVMVALPEALSPSVERNPWAGKPDCIESMLWEIRDFVRRNG